MKPILSFFSMEQRVIDVFLDMETGDPDDCITLLFLLTSPKVSLRGVTVYPGCHNQIGFVKGLIRTYGSESQKDLPVGCFNKQLTKNHLGANNVKLFGGDMDWKPEEADDFGHIILVCIFSSQTHYCKAELCKKYPSGRLVTGGPLGNLHDLLVNHPEVELEETFVQGSFMDNGQY